MPKRVFYWTGMTATQSFNTGVQRVTRALGRAFSDLGIEVIPVKWDEADGCMAPLDAGEAAHLEQWNGPPARAPSPLPNGSRASGWCVPEITVPARPLGSNIAQFARGLGMRMAAIFYDLIPLKMAQHLPAGACCRPSCNTGICSRRVDVALPISWTVAADLRRYLSERGLRLPAIYRLPARRRSAGRTATARPARAASGRRRFGCSPSARGSRARTTQRFCAP